MLVQGNETIQGRVLSMKVKFLETGEIYEVASQTDRFYVVGEYGHMLAIGKNEAEVVDDEG